MSFLVSTAEFDLEVTARHSGDVAISIFTGVGMDNSDIPIGELPVYSSLYPLVDLIDGVNLFEATSRLDVTKQSRQIWHTGATAVSSNPRRVRSDGLMRLAPLAAGEMLLTLAAEIGWDDDQATQAVGLGTTESHLPSGHVVTGGYVSMVTIGRIAATFQVIGGVSLVGRRVKAVPPGTVPSTYAVKRKLVFAFTGADKDITVQAGETWMDVEIWAGGGLNDNAAQGGAGGYTWGRFPVSTGQQFSVMVGEKGKASGSIYGFGGVTSSGNVAGGGLSGIFSGAGTILVSDSARAIAVAGGGGGGQNDVSGYILGQHGNTVHTDTTSDFAGVAGGSGHSGGGGGYQGGGANGNMGRNGLGYLHSSKLRGAIMASTGGLAVDAACPPPGIGSTNYVAPQGYAGQNGLIVVTLCGAP